jgi:hypothetical protein
MLKPANPDRARSAPTKAGRAKPDLSNAKSSPPQVSGPQSPIQLTPRPRLFKFLCLLFAFWMIALLVMYFWTVYPARHH